MTAKVKRLPRPRNVPATGHILQAIRTLREARWYARETPREFQAIVWVVQRNRTSRSG